MTNRVAHRIFRRMLLPCLGMCLLLVLALAPSLHLMGHVHEAAASPMFDSADEVGSVPNEPAAPGHEAPKDTETSTCVTCLLLTASKVPPPVSNAVATQFVSADDFVSVTVPDCTPHAILHSSAGPRAPPDLG